ncbi:hypothetical protein O9K51_03603 [Purpureocillium lavendulum]|uniref:Uncharacterized protein n=1 Tax=Purpureocillium lavendulum TaxID=1247861 RepID=A0AB34G0K2_9HYPO|nr:hypothetical protein O9K51_03603 [Purpureocillium lavendulum]
METLATQKAHDAIFELWMILSNDTLREEFRSAATADLRKRFPASTDFDSLVANYMEDMQALAEMELYDRVKQAQASAQSKGRLLIDGQTLTEILEEFNVPDEDLDALRNHIERYRPHLTKLLPHIEPSYSMFLPYVEKMNLDSIDDRVHKAMKADEASVALDRSVWAAKVWRWEKR